MVGLQMSVPTRTPRPVAEGQAGVLQHDAENRAASSYRTPMDRGAGCLLPEDFGALLDGDVAGDLEEPLRVDAFGLIAFIALMRTASN